MNYSPWKRMNDGRKGSLSPNHPLAEKAVKEKTDRPVRICVSCTGAISGGQPSLHSLFSACNCDGSSIVLSDGKLNCS